MQIKIGGSVVDVKTGTFEMEDSIDERSTCSFIVLDPTNSATYSKGQPVLITTDSHKLIFGGVIEESEATVTSPDDYTFHSIQCVDWHYLADKRIIAEAYEDKTIDYIVKDIVDTYLVDEGVQYITADADQVVFLQPSFPAEIPLPGSVDTFATLDEAVFNYISASQALDALKEEANAWWRIEPNKNLYFVKREHLVYPETVDQTFMLNGSITCKHGNPKYRNRQWIIGGEDLTDEQTEIQIGDGDKRAFALGYRVGKVPTISVSTGGGAYAIKTVGIKGVETGKDWYWNKYSETITQDDAGTLLTSADKVKIVYYGVIDIIVLTDNRVEIDARKTLEGAGTGYVENVISDSSLESKEAAIDLGLAKIKKYAVVGKTLSFTTRTEDFEPGHLITVDLPEYGLNSAEMLIERVTAYNPANSNLIFYTIEAVEGPTQGSWQKFFSDISEKTDTAVIRQNISDNATIVILFDYSKTWTSTETKNIFDELYPSATEPLYHATQGLSFKAADRIKYLAWYNDADVELGRKAITSQDGEELGSEEIETMTYLTSADGVGDTIFNFGWIGGMNATATGGTGIIVDYQAHPDGSEAKTALASWQVEKTDTKWS